MDENLFHLQFNLKFSLVFDFLLNKFVYFYTIFFFSKFPSLTLEQLHLCQRTSIHHLLNCISFFMDSKGECGWEQGGKCASFSTQFGPFFNYWLPTWYVYLLLHYFFFYFLFLEIFPSFILFKLSLGCFCKANKESMCYKFGHRVTSPNFFQWVWTLGICLLPFSFSFLFLFCVYMFFQLLFI